MTEKNKKISSQSAARQQQLLKAALDVVARRGLSGITINDIADEAGCSYGVIAFHFKTKEKMLLAVLDFLAESYEEIWRSTISASVSSPAEQLRKLVDLDFDARVAKSKYLAVWMAFWAEASRVPAYRKRCNELKLRSLAVITELVAELAALRVVKLDPDLVAQGLYAITDGRWVFSHVTGQNGPGDRENSRRVCLAYLASYFPSDFSVEEQKA